MITIPLWAKQHPRLSQFLIVIFLTVQILFAFEVGIRLSILGVYLGDWIKYLAFAAVSALILAYPTREELKKLSWFTQRRYLFLGGQILMWSGFLLAMCFTNRLATPDYVIREMGKPYVLKVAIQEQPKSSRDGFLGKEKTNIKSWKKAFRDLVKERKAQLQSDKNQRSQKGGGGGGGIIALFVFLSTLLAVAIGYLSCLLICSGGGFIALGLIVGLGGALAIFSLNCLGTRWAYGSTDKGKAAAMSILGWLLVLAGIIWGFDAMGDW